VGSNEAKDIGYHTVIIDLDYTNGKSYSIQIYVSILPVTNTAPYFVNKGLKATVATINAYVGVSSNIMLP
jgi:hypothetical protein